MIAGVAIWGTTLVRAHPEMHLNAPPLFGRVSPHLSWRAAPAVVLGLAAIACAPRAADRLPWKSLLVVAVTAAAGWALALSFAGGESSWYGPLLGPHDYLMGVARIESLPEWLGTFTDGLVSESVHVQGHPPGMAVVLYGLAQLGLGGGPWAAAVVIGAGASGAAAVLIALRRVVDERTARAAAPFVIFAPAAIWIATSADALFAGVAAWGIALGLIAVTANGPRADAAAVGGGLVFGIALLLAYGVALLVLLVIAAAWTRSRLRSLSLYALAASIVLAIAGILGFWWPAGLLSTRSAYLAGVAADRPYWFFLASNLTAFALVLGPATAVALTRKRVRRVWVVLGPAFAAVGLAALSGMSEGEVERIWLPFAIWILPASCALPESSRSRWLTTQVVTAMAIELLVVTPW